MSANALLASLTLLFGLVVGCNAQTTLSTVTPTPQVGIEALADQSPVTAPFVVRFFIRNTTTTGISLLPWGTPLEMPLTADAFDVSRDGAPLDYTGIMVKRAPPAESDYLHIAAGESVAATLTLSDSYDMSVPGRYEVQLKQHDSEYRIGNTSFTLITSALVIVRSDT